MNNFENKLWGVISGNWGLQNICVKCNWEQNYCWISALGIVTIPRAKEGVSSVFYFQFYTHILLHSHSAGTHVPTSCLDTNIMHWLYSTALPCSEIISYFNHILICLRLKSLCVFFLHQRQYQGSKHIQFHCLISTGSSSELSLTLTYH